MRLTCKLFSDGIYIAPKLEINHRYQNARNGFHRFLLETKDRFITPPALKNKALIAQGGGMKAVAQLGGYLMAFHEYRYNPFKVLAGTSASALVMAAYLSGNIEKVTEIFNLLKDLIDASWKGKIKTLFSIELGINQKLKPFPVNEIVDELFDSKIIDIDRILKNKAKFYITTTNTHTGLGHLHDVKDFAKKRSLEEIKTIFKMTANYPVLCGDHFKLDGEIHFDGGIGRDYAIPYKAALKNSIGFEDMMIVLTQTDKTKYDSPLNIVSRHLVRKVHHPHSKIYQAIEQVPHHTRNQIDHIFEKAKNRETSVLFHRQDFPVDIATTDLSALNDGLYQSYEQAIEGMKKIGHSVSHEYEEQKSFNPAYQ